MISRLLLILSSLLLLAPRSPAQQSPDPKQQEFANWANQELMNRAQFHQLFAKAQAGDAEAQYFVGCVYNRGRLVPRNPEEAQRWFLKSAEQSYPPAEGAYGMGARIANPAVGERWMLRAAEHGDASTQLWLAIAYDDDWFGTIDHELALRWYRKAAESGDPDAQAVLGQKYADGDGVDQNYQLAAQWFRKAAEHFPDLGGAGQGRNELGLLYLQGLGVPQDYVQAYFWFSLRGNEGNAEDAKAHLSATQIAQTDKLVKDWNDHHQLAPELAAASHMPN